MTFFFNYLVPRPEEDLRRGGLDRVAVLGGGEEAAGDGEEAMGRGGGGLVAELFGSRSQVPGSDSGVHGGRGHDYLHRLIK